MSKCTKPSLYYLPRCRSRASTLFRSRICPSELPGSRDGETPGGGVAAFVGAEDHEREQDLFSKSHPEQFKSDRRYFQRHLSGVTEANLTGTGPAEYFEPRGAARISVATSLK